MIEEKADRADGADSRFPLIKNIGFGTSTHFIAVRYMSHIFG